MLYIHPFPKSILTNSCLTFQRHPDKGIFPRNRESFQLIPSFSILEQTYIIVIFITTAAMKTLQDLVDTFSGNSGPAVIIPQDNPLNLSYNDLYNQIQCLQVELASLGLNTLSRVFIILPNSFEFIALFLAISCMRAIAVPLNPGLKQEEYASYLKDLNPSAVIVPEGTLRERHGVTLAALDKGTPIIECHTSKGQITLGSTYKASSGMEAMTMLDRPAEQDVALILYTSGTSGWPKIVSETT